LGWEWLPIPMVMVRHGCHRFPMEMVKQEMEIAMVTNGNGNGNG
jgi:hypothetical protein